MRGLYPILKRELAGYFVTPVAYVFIVIFLALAGVFTFELGGFFEAGQADLRAFFGFLPWLFLCLIPAVSMRLWAEERRGGTIELLMTLPVTRAGAVVGKFLAAWVFVGIAIVLTFPLWITVNYLGGDRATFDLFGRQWTVMTFSGGPDNGAILTGYIGALLLAGGFLAVGAAISAATRSQIIAFILSVVVCFGFLLAGYTPVIDFFRGWAPASVVDTIASFSFLTRFDAIGKGVIDLRDVVFFGSLIVVCLVINGLLLDTGKGD
jgi:ABC-2 type transport system permease protein